MITVVCDNFFKKLKFFCSCSQDLHETSHEFDTDEGRTDAGDSMSIQTGTTGPVSRRYVMLFVCFCWHCTPTCSCYHLSGSLDQIKWAS